MRTTGYNLKPHPHSRELIRGSWDRSLHAQVFSALWRSVKSLHCLLPTLARVILCVLVLNCSTARSEYLQVIGTIRYCQIGTNSEIKVLSESNFQAKGDTKSWQITSIPVIEMGRTNIRTKSVSVGCDGSSLYLLRELKQVPHSVDKTLATNTNHLPAGAVPIFNYLDIKSGTIPYMDAGFTAIIWIPYFSHNFVNWNIIHSFRKLYSMNELNSEKVFVSIAASPYPGSQQPALLGTIRFFNRGKNVVAWPDGTISESQLPPPFEKEYTEAVYRLVSTVEFAGHTYAKEFRIEYYKSKPNPSSPSDQMSNAWVEANVQQVSILPGAVTIDYLQQLQFKTYIVDRRIQGKSGTPIAYVSTNKVYNSNETGFDRVIKNHEARARLIQHASKPSHEGLGRAVGIAIVVASAIFFGWLGLKLVNTSKKV
jgi:hypothetical protein